MYNFSHRQKHCRDFKTGEFITSTSSYEKYVSALSPETLGCLRGHLEGKYQRTDFDVLEWADHSEIAEFVFDGFLEGSVELERWGKTIELAAVNMLEAYLNEDAYTKTTLKLLIERLNCYQREKLEERKREID